jgi:Recombination endonuclease VII
MQLPTQPCAVCQAPFTPRRRVDKTCSADCSVRWRRQLSRQSVARRYQPRPQRPPTMCEGCGVTMPAPRTGRLRRWCEPCRANREDQRARQRVAVRRCYKCQIDLPEAARRRGKAVCESCRVDPRVRSAGHEHRRRLRKYGLTQEDYDRLLSEQVGCAGCGSSDAGPKGWMIDHCHESGRVRALLCYRCNTALGMFGDDPAPLRALALFIERQNEISRT